MGEKKTKKKRDVEKHFVEFSKIRYLESELDQTVKHQDSNTFLYHITCCQTYWFHIITPNSTVSCDKYIIDLMPLVVKYACEVHELRANVN